MKGIVFLLIALIVLLVISKYMEKNEQFATSDDNVVIHDPIRETTTDENNCGNGWVDSCIGCASFVSDEQDKIKVIQDMNNLKKECDGKMLKRGKFYVCPDSEDCNSLNMKSTCLGGCATYQRNMSSNNFSSLGCPNAMSGYLVSCKPT